MARENHTNSLMESPITAEESSAMEADREAEAIRPEPEPESAPEPAPEPAAAEPEAPEAPEQPEIDPATGKKRMVEYGALHSERERRKASDAAKQETDKKLATLMGRFQVLEELARPKMQAAPAEAPIEVPDINVDPVGHFQAKDAIRERELTELRNWKSAQDKQAEVRTNVTRIQELAQAHEAEFSKVNPDYNEAFTFLRSNRDAELQAMGYVDAGVRNQIINNDALQIAAQALQTNRNAAEAVYNIAKARGWAGKVTPQPIPAQPAPVTPHPDAAKLAKIAKGQEANASISQANGSAPPVSTPEMIAKMSDAEFDKWATEDNWRKLMGG